ncbi:low density lipoprotein receptor adapter protein 1-like [Rhineura floridana]|uniref:low density lipoprotein receptor adapter protein 1-like n=1 Tax=Rhineura floridana TaxID=261503 RepID=UPI002AC874BA|nr:low density lipoprotein receptor adapter protein 1-like [Rhineura floridana]
MDRAHLERKGGGGCLLTSLPAGPSRKRLLTSAPGLSALPFAAQPGSIRLRWKPACSVELPETWADMREPLLEGMGFALKYLGMTLVEKPKGEDMATAAIHRIIDMARVGPKKFRKVVLTVSPRGLSLQDAETKETIGNISIYRISYCTTDKLQNKVFAYVAQNPQSGALECHAFLSPKKKIAQAVTLTVAQAFQVALDLWEAAQAGSREEEGEEQQPTFGPLCPVESTCQPARSPVGSPPFKTNFEEEEEEEGGLNEAFSGCGRACVGGLSSHAPPASGSLGQQPSSSSLPPGMFF